MEFVYVEFRNGMKVLKEENDVLDSSPGLQKTNTKDIDRTANLGSCTHILTLHFYYHSPV